MISLLTGKQQFKSQLVNQGSVSLGMLQHRVDEHRLLLRLVRQQVRVRAADCIEKLINIVIIHKLIE